jgi:hypothetical protein
VSRSRIRGSIHLLPHTPLLRGPHGVPSPHIHTHMPRSRYTSSPPYASVAGPTWFPTHRHTSPDQDTPPLPPYASVAGPTQSCTHHQERRGHKSPTDAPVDPRREANHVADVVTEPLGTCTNTAHAQIRKCLHAAGQPISSTEFPPVNLGPARVSNPTSAVRASIKPMYSCLKCLGGPNTGRST